MSAYVGSSVQRPPPLEAAQIHALTDASALLRRTLGEGLRDSLERSLACRARAAESFRHEDDPRTAARPAGTRKEGDAAEEEAEAEAEAGTTPPHFCRESFFRSAV